MSRRATDWAARQSPAHAFDKFVLWALADAADRQTDECFPSVAAICAFTLLTRKIVLASVTRLIEVGLVEDTGRRTGRTKQIRVLRLLVEANGP